MKEKVVEAYLVKRVKALGGEVRKVEWISRRGAPDRLIMMPGRPEFWVELKAPNGKLEPHQEREHVRMRKLGVKVYVVNHPEQIDELIK